MVADCMRSIPLSVSLAVAGVATVLYLNSLPGEFVFDDQEAIESNADVRINTPLWSIFGNDFWGLPLSDPESHKSYRPLTVLTFRANRLLHGMWPPGFHIVNVATHALVSVLFLWLSLSLGLGMGPSLAAACLFAAHPVHTEAVASIVGRTELLAAVFYLLSLMAYKHSLQLPSTKKSYFNKRPERCSLIWIAVSMTLAVVSLLCKEQGITVLGACLAYDIFVACRIDLASLAEGLRCLLQIRRREEWRPPPKWLKLLLKRSVLLIISTLAIIFLRVFLIGRGSPSFVDSDNPASFSPHYKTRLLTYCYLCAHNFWLLLCPSRLCFDWSMGSFPLVETLSDWRNAATASLGILLVSLSFYGLFEHQKQSQKPDSSHLAGNIPSTKVTVESKQRSGKTNTTGGRKHLTLFALALLVLPFLPASNLLFPVGFVVAERVLYLPSMGFCLLVAVGYGSLWDSCQTRKFLYLWTKVKAVVLFSVLLAFSIKTFTRNLEWRDSQILAESALRVNPGNAKVHMSMGNVLTQQGNRTCEWFYREALRLRPHYTAAWTNLGLVLLNTERPREAEDCYRRALSIKQDHINANINMGHLCRLQQRWEEARQHYHTASRRRPSNPFLHYYMGFVSEQLGTAENVQQAELEYRRATELHPSYWEAHVAMAHLLSTTTSNGRKLQYGHSKGRRTDEAVYHYRKAIQLRQTDENAHYELGKLLLSKGSVREAEKELLVAVKLSPGHALAHMELGSVYENLGNKRLALSEFETALKLNGALVVARQKLADLT